MMDDFEVGELVKLKKFRYARGHDYYGLVMSVGKQFSWHFDDRYVNVLWAKPDGAQLVEEKKKYLRKVHDDERHFQNGRPSET